MTQYIDKDALLAEIDRQKIGYNVDGKHSVEYDITRKIIDIINAFEIKEVDLEKVIEEYFKGWTDDYDNGGAACHYQYVQVNDCKAIAKHFFELGLKASNVLTWEDMKQIHDIMIECSAIGLWSKPDEEYYQEVVKRFKTQKVE